MIKISTAETMKLDGGNPALDLVNSGYAAHPGEVVERLHHFTDLLNLSGRHGFIDDSTTASLVEKATSDPTEAEVVLEEVKEVRTALYSLFNSLATSETEALDKNALNIFNSYLAKALSHRKISMRGNLLVRDWEVKEGDLRQVLYYYLLSAFEVLTGHLSQYVKKCCGCAWMFVDGSKNHRRKWCDMQVCGSSEKAKRYYRKRKETDTV